jgi:hypothetical protein
MTIRRNIVSKEYHGDKAARLNPDIIRVAQMD